MLSLSELRPGERGVVCQLPAGNERQLLYELGLIPGTIIEIVAFAPWGDPVICRLRGSTLALRRQMVAQITVNPLPTSTSSVGERRAV